MTSAIDVPIDAAPVQRRGRHIEHAATGRLRTLMAAGVVLSVATAATQVMAVAPPVRAAVTLVFAMVGPGAAVVATLLLCGAATSRDGRAISLRLPPVVLAALVVPASVTVLVLTAQTMLWLQIWRPAAALVVLAIVSAAPLLAAVTALVRSGATTDDDGGRADAPAGDLDTVTDGTAENEAFDDEAGDAAAVKPADPAEVEAADVDAVADGSGDEDGDPQPHSGETTHAETAPNGDSPQLPHLDETIHTETASNGDDRQAPDRAGVTTGSAS